MRIARVYIKNFGPYKKHEIQFYRSLAKKDLFVIYGITGKGKTTFLSAIHWALYGTEFESRGIKKDDKSLFNKSRLIEMDEGEKDFIEVVVDVEDNDGKKVTFRRRAYYVKQNGIPNKLHEEVEYLDESGKPFSDPESVSIYINRFIPKSVSKFFLMDGESITSRFFRDSAKEIASEIRKMAQIDILDIARDRLKDVKRDKERKFARGNTSLEELMSMKSIIEDEIDGLSGEIKRYEEEVELLKSEIESLSRDLRGIPNVSELEIQRRDLEKQIKHKEEKLKQKIEEKRKVLITYGAFVLFDYPIDELEEFIIWVDTGAQSPIVTNKAYLEKSLSDGACVLCGTPLSDESREKIEKDLQKLEHGNEFVEHKSIFITHIDSIKQRKQELVFKVKEINEDIADLEEDINRLRRSLGFIEEQLASYNVEEIASKYRLLKEKENRRDFLIREIGAKSELLRQKQDELRSIAKKIEILNVENAERTRLEKQIKLADRLLKLIANVRDAVENDIRKELEKETYDLFSSIIWNPENFDRLEIDTTFNVRLYHKETGMDVTYELSGGQSKILAMAFTIALHKVIKYSSPIIVDRPIVNISGDDLIKSMIDMFVKVSDYKQVILLLTPDEIPEHLAPQLESYASAVYEIENHTGNEAHIVMKR